ncbi:MAG: glycerol-3-phosphate 1-O-acyltransferase PlsY [Ruminococcaceae bacterium]|nr:glycerol-3-phosphate 1-O-acyltransferase PlsY [Oscillospiraceae bacterium]
MDMLYKLIILLVSYLLGSINTSIIISKIMIGDDIRNHGSGNAGATNTLRTVGKLGAILVVIGDILKAVIAILLARLVFAKYIPEGTELATYIAGIGAVLGHNFPVFFKFKGGKGIIVSTVAIIFADPLLGAITAVSAIAIMAISRYVSLGSILGAVIFVVLALVFKAADTVFVAFALMLAVLAIYMHRTNIVRLLSGKENKLSFSKKQ